MHIYLAGEQNNLHIGITAYTEQCIHILCLGAGTEQLAHRDNSICKPEKVLYIYAQCVGLISQLFIIQCNLLSLHQMTTPELW